MKVHVAAAERRGSEGPSEGIRRIRRGFPEEEPSATAVCIDEGRGKSAALTVAMVKSCVPLAKVNVGLKR